MAEAHSSRSHARLAPSAAHRWAACPGSVVLEAAIPDGPSSLAANEGTAAHELAAHCLTMGFDTKRFIGRKIDINGKDAATIFLHEDAPGGPDDGIFEVTAEMAEHVQDYIALVRRTANAKPPGELLVERRVHATRIHPEDVHGTADAIVYRDDTKTLHVFDLKYGRGVPVEAVGNRQIVCYASGAAVGFHNRGVEKVVGHIFQPRCPHRDGPHRTWEMLFSDLEGEEATLADATADVAAAERDRGDVSPHLWEANYLEPGDHCRFCKAAATCPARSAMALEVAQSEFGDTTELRPPEQMDDAELAKVLTKARQIQHWIKAVEEHAHKRAMGGHPPTGFKLVAGRATRAWGDEEKLKKLLPVFVSANVDDLYEEPKLLSPAKLEKLLPKEERASIAPFVVKRSGSTQLVPDDDPRPAVAPDAASEFDSVESD